MGLNGINNGGLMGFNGLHGINNGSSMGFNRITWDLMGICKFHALVNYYITNDGKWPQK